MLFSLKLLICIWMEDCHTFKDQNLESGLYFRQEATFFHKGQSLQDSTGNRAQGLELKEQIQFGVRSVLFCYTSMRSGHALVMLFGSWWWTRWLFEIYTCGQKEAEAGLGRGRSWTVVRAQQSLGSLWKMVPWQVKTWLYRLISLSLLTMLPREGLASDRDQLPATKAAPLKNLFICLFLAVLGLRCCAGFSLVVVCGLIALTSIVVAHGLSSCSSSWAIEHGLNSGGTWA